MNQVDQNINKDMIDSDLIDVDSLDLCDDQTWLYTVPNDSGEKVDIVDWNLSCEWSNPEDHEYQQLEKKLNSIFDNILTNQIHVPDKRKFDSRTFVKPKKRTTRPSIQSIVEIPSNPSSITPTPSLNANTSSNKYLTYNKYTSPLGPISPMLRLKTFNIDTNTENSNAIKEALKRRSFGEGHDEDPQLEDIDMTLCSDASGRLSMEHTATKPINIDLSQPAHNIHNTFNKGLTNILNERSSLNMYQSGESLMRMSPPSLVSSLMMESSGNFNPESMESKKSLPSHRDSAPPPPSRESLDPMMTSMTLSILDEKDMSTSFLSQTTYPDNDSLMDSLPPSLVSSVNSSYVVSTSKPKVTDSSDSNIFSSTTFTHLEQSEKLLSARPRIQLFNSLKRESLRNSESYTKSREEACQIDTVKVLNENAPNESPKSMTETITLHYSNNRFRSNEEKENFERSDVFYKDMGVQRPEDIGRGSLNVTLGKQELNEIIQARQKLSLARKALPTESDKLPNQVDTTSPVKTIQLPNQTITVPRQSIENASELLTRRRLNGFDKEEPTRETPKRNATFKKISPRGQTGFPTDATVSPRGPTATMDATVVFNKEDNQNDIIDINSATMNLIDGAERTLQQEEWCLQERAMVGSSDSTDTGTFSSSSPPDSVPDTVASHDRHQIASTPLIRGVKNDLLNLHTTISPIYDMVEDKSYTVTKAPERTYLHDATVINTATLVKKTTAKRDILAGKCTPEKKSPVQLKPPSSRVSPISTVSYGSMMPPSGLPRKSSLPTSKLRQYSSHRELNRIPAGIPGPAPQSALRGCLSRTMIRRGVYASNPALSPTASHPIDLGVLTQKPDDRPSRPTLANPPALVRQGTETLRRDRPQSQLIAPRDVRGVGGAAFGLPVSMRTHQIPPPSRPTSIASASQLRVSRPASGPVQKPAPVAVLEQPRPSSGLPRPSRLPAPRRALRPPSVYSVAPTADAENY